MSNNIQSEPLIEYSDIMDIDELLFEAREIVIRTGKVSALMLQRRLSVGHARALKMIEMLEKVGTIGPSDGTSNREILSKTDLTDEQLRKLLRPLPYLEKIPNTKNSFIRIQKIKVKSRLLKSVKNKPVSGNIKKVISLIEDVLKRFNIVVDETYNPVISPTATTYSFRPVSRARIKDITDNLIELRNAISYEIRVNPIRIIISGEDVHIISIEVPNIKRGVTVSLKTELETKDFKNFEGGLVIPFGRDKDNKQVIVDLCSFPNLLIGGVSGSGKSTFLHSLIISLMAKHSPETLKFILADAKRIDMPSHNGSPYLLTPVIVESEKLLNALDWCIYQMEIRYDLLYTSACKNIIEYNSKHEEKMSYIVFIMDEMSDFILADGKKFEGSVIRLMQMSRAVGIHLILSTSRPSREIYTGLLKANCPMRIAFAVSSRKDSKYLLDTTGAENLAEQGDALFLAPGEMKPVRLQTPYVSEEDIERVVKYLKK